MLNLDVHCYLTRYHLDFDNSIHREAKILRLSRLACPPSFWRGLTQEKIAETTRLTRGRVVQIVNNTNFGEINTLLSQGRDMEYIARRYHMDLALTSALRLDGKSDQEHFEYLKFFRELLPLFKENSKTNACIALLNADRPPAPLPAP